MAATLMLACSNDKSGGHDGDEGVETEVNGTQLDGNTTLYGLVTDTSGNPIPGVVVSDGYGCVTTDANGVYQMERYKKARFVHYSTPAGYAINTSADNYPLFYAEIVHKNIADRHDFVLTPLPAPESDFTLVCIADPQCSTTAEISRYVNETIPDIEATADAYKAKGTPVYGITLGDIVFDTPDLWSNMKESMANRNLPVFQTIGNHDHLQTETSDDNAAANFETQFGPRNYSFNRGDVHIVSMDNVLYEGKKKYKGGITDKQLEWLRQDLSHVDKDKLVIFCAHIPFRGGTSVTDESHENYDGVLDLLSGFSEAHIMSAIRITTRNTSTSVTGRRSSNMSTAPPAVHGGRRTSAPTARRTGTASTRSRATPLPTSTTSRPTRKPAIRSGPIRPRRCSASRAASPSAGRPTPRP